MSARARCLLSIRCRRQLAAVAESARGCQDPDHRLGRSRALGAGAAIVTVPLGRSPSRRPRPRKRRGGWPAEHPSPTWVPRWARLVGAVRIASLTTGLANGVQDGSTIPANVTTQATTQLEAGVPFTSDSDRKAQLQKANVPPDQAGCDSESQQRRPPCRAARLALGGRAHRRRRRVLHRTDPHRAGWASPSRNWPLLIPPRRLPADPPVSRSSMPGQPTQAY